MIEFPPTVLRSERNEFVLRLAVKVAVAGHLLFTIVWPLVDLDPSAKIWLVSRVFGHNFITIVAGLIAVTVVAGQWVRQLRIAGGIAYMSFCLTYAALVGEWRLALFSVCMSFCGLALAWTGVPEDD